MDDLTQSCDLLIKNGRILDGTGADWTRLDIAVDGDTITAMGDLKDWRATNEIDATDRFVTPGFIEEHSHSDTTLLVDPLAQSAVRQGMTTMTVGLCGMSAAPIAPAQREEYSQTTSLLNYEGVDWSWSSFAEYLDALRNAGPSVNVLALAGHIPMRMSVMANPNRAAKPAEINAMRDMLTVALEQGAGGFTTGLNYKFCVFATTEEIIEIARALVPFGKAYHTHMRDYGPKLVEAVEEAIQIAETAGVPLVISHMYPSGRDNWGKSKRCIELVEQARARGVEVGFDVTPWLRGGGPLEQILPPWIRDEGMAAGVARLKRDPQARARLAVDIEKGGDWPGWLRPEWDQWLVYKTGRTANRKYMGLSIAQIATQLGMTPVDAAINLYVEDDGQVCFAPQNKCDEDIDRLLSHPLGVPIADAFALAPEGALAHQDRPNSYGTFPRVFEHYVRERGVLTWPQAVQKLTAVPAQRLGLFDRGLLRPGLKSDIVIFDPVTIAARADYACPQEFPVGIEWVIVNGRITVNPDGHTGTQAGEIT
jgi:N-acyl-D-aspartate/D-glutamate deacylase